MDFPNSPIVGQIFTVNGKQWIWSGTSWNSRTANTTFQGHAGTHAVGQSDAVTIAQSQVTNLVADITAKSNIASPTFTGIPAAPTAAPQTNTTQIATTAFVANSIALSTIPDASTTTKMASGKSGCCGLLMTS